MLMLFHVATRLQLENIVQLRKVSTIDKILHDIKNIEYSK